MAIDAAELPIINRAMRRLGQREFANLAEVTTPTTKKADIVNGEYENHRDSMIQDHPWNDHIFRANLTTPTTPEWGFLYAYAFPDGATPAGKPYALRILEINDKLLWGWTTWQGWIQNESYRSWKVEARNLLVDISDNIDIRYLGRDPTAAADWQPLFRECLALYCAMNWGEALQASNDLQSRLEVTFEKKIAEARSIDGQEGIQDGFDTSAYVSARVT